VYDAVKFVGCLCCATFFGCFCRFEFAAVLCCLYVRVPSSPLLLYRQVVFIKGEPWPPRV